MERIITTARDMRRVTVPPHSNRITIPKGWADICRREGTQLVLILPEAKDDWEAGE